MGTVMLKINDIDALKTATYYEGEMFNTTTGFVLVAGTSGSVHGCGIHCHGMFEVRGREARDETGSGYDLTFRDHNGDWPIKLRSNGNPNTLCGKDDKEHYDASVSVYNTGLDALF